MHKYFSFLFILFFSPFISLAQQEYSISGKVVGSDNLPISYSDVRAYKTQDSTFIMGGMTNDDGIFDFPLPNGKYYVTIEFLGLNTDTLLVEIKNKNLNVGQRILKADVTQLDNVTIISERSTMEFQIDKRVYNVGADLNNQGINASEMLENIPSVAVDADGNVSLRGNANVRILIDGKYSGFASSGDALKQLQSDQVEKVEIITNASSRYDAEGDAGIINIVLKENKKPGWNGSINTRVGLPLEYGVGFNYNIRKDKWNFYANYDINRFTNPSNSQTFQQLNTPDTSFIYQQHYKGQRKNVGNSGRVGIDYDINKHNTISASMSFRTRNGNSFIDRVYDNMDESKNILFQDTRYEYGSMKHGMLEGNIDYKLKLNDKGAEWNTTLKAFKAGHTSGSDFSEISTGQVDSTFEKSKDVESEQYQLVQSDLIFPFSETGKFETGIKGQWKELSSDFAYTQFNGATWNEVPQFNDIAIYSEDVYAAYLMGSEQFGKIGVQAGIRAEYSNISTEQKASNTIHNKNYLDWFPSAALSYKFNENQTLQLSYSKRIRRPGRWELMPFRHFGDNREMRTGNPDIDPEITHAIEAGWMQYFNKVSILSSVYYRKTLDKIERMAIVGTDGIIYRTPMNIASKDAGGLELNITYNPVNWIKISSGFNFYKEAINGEFEGKDFHLENFSWSNRSSINATLPKKWRVQLSGNYSAPTVTPQGKSLAMRFMDFGVSKDFWNNNATIGFNVRDIFNTRKWRGETNTPTLVSYNEFQWRPRSYKLVFTYRFNQSPKDRERNNGNNMMDQQMMEADS